MNSETLKDLQAQLKQIKIDNLMSLKDEIKGIVAQAIEDIKQAAQTAKDDIKGEIDQAIEDAISELTDEAEEAMEDAAA